MKQNYKKLLTNIYFLAKHHKELNGLLMNDLDTIEGWFNVISPKKKKLSILKDELQELKNKNWPSILV